MVSLGERRACTARRSRSGSQRRHSPGINPASGGPHADAEGTTAPRSAGISTEGVALPDTDTATLAVERAQSDAPEFSADMVAALREELERDPDRVMAEAPALRGPSPHRCGHASHAQRSRKRTAQRLRNPRLAEGECKRWSFELPAAHRFPGYELRQDRGNNGCCVLTFTDVASSFDTSTGGGARAARRCCADRTADCGSRDPLT